MTQDIEEKPGENITQKENSKIEIEGEDNSGWEPFDEEEMGKVPPFLRKLMMRKKIVYDSIKRDMEVEE